MCKVSLENLDKKSSTVMHQALNRGSGPVSGALDVPQTLLIENHASGKLFSGRVFPVI